MRALVVVLALVAAGCDAPSGEAVGSARILYRSGVTVVARLCDGTTAVYVITGDGKGIAVVPGGCAEGAK